MDIKIPNTLYRHQWNTFTILYKFFIFLLLMQIHLSCSESINNKVSLNKELNILTPKNKIWAHRFNSLINIQKRIDSFYGIEVDIFYNKTNNNFEVKHDLKSTGIDLEFFLDSVLKVKEVLFWFDYKNLNEQTNSGVSTLCTILFERQLEKLSFVESCYGDNLESFNGKVATSFWVSATLIPEQKKKRDNLYEEKYKHIKQLNVNMLSANYKMYDFITEYFPNHKCNYWMSGSLTKEKKSVLNKMAISPNVNIILIDGNKNLLN